MNEFVFAVLLLIVSVYSLNMGMKEKEKGVISLSIKIRYFGVAFMGLLIVLILIFRELI